jgi:hypothetical protein
MSFKPTYKTGGTNPAKSKPSKNDRDMVSGVSSILRKIKDKKNRKEVAGDMVNQFNREGVNYNKEKFLKNSRSFAAGGPVKPIYTSNPNDPRLKKYNDSLISYNEGEAGYNRHKATVKNNIKKNNAGSYMWENPLVYKETSEVPMAFGAGWKNPHGITPISSTLIYAEPDKSGYFGSLRESSLPNKKTRSSHAREAYRYKKPVQPIIYKPAAKKSTMTTMSKTPNKKAITTSTTPKTPKNITSKVETSSSTTIPTTVSTTTPTTSTTSTTPSTSITSTAPKTTLTTTPTTTVQTPKQLPGNTSQMQKYDYMSTEDKKRAVKKYGDPSKIPFQGVNINQLRKEVPTFQGGGTRSPIYVSNPNDPRLRRYNDSMSLYQTTRSMEPMFAANPNDPRLPAYNKKAADIATRSGIKPTTLRTVGGENPYSSDFDPMMMEEPYFAKFKKPVQPVVMDPLAEIKKIKGMGIAKPITDSASTSLPTSVNIPMRIRKQLPTVKHTNNYEDFDIRIHNTPGERYYREVVIPMKKQRARAPAKHTKNYPDTPGRGYKKGGITTKEQKLSQLYKAFKLKK